MGVDRSDVIIVGVNIGQEHYDEDDWEKEESEYDKYSLDRKSKVGDIAYIFDGMGGRYFIIGELLKVDYDGYNGLGMFIYEEKTKEIKAAKKRVKAHILEKFKIETDPKCIVLSHFH